MKLSTFFGRPFDFSFKDSLALGFTLFYFFISFTICFSSYFTIKNVELLKYLLEKLNVIELVILGGYFGHEGIVAYFESKRLYQESYTSESIYNKGVNNYENNN